MTRGDEETRRVVSQRLDWALAVQNRKKKRAIEEEGGE